MAQAIYFDGQSAHLHRVELDTAGATITLAGDGVAKVYAAAEARLAEPFARSPRVLYFSDGARCEFGRADWEPLAELLGYRKPLAVRWQENWPAALGALVLLIALICAIAFIGVPAAAEKIAAGLPESVDDTLGQSALAGLEKKQLLLPSRFSDQRLEQVGQVLHDVLPAHPRKPIRLLVRSAPTLGANALALPDGTIVVTDEMVRLALGDARDFDEDVKAALAGVVAHEVGHIERRHAARAMTRASLTAALSAALFGDFSAVAAGAPAVLSNMEYSRAMETEADEYAIDMLRQRGIDIDPLADLFEMLDDEPQAKAARDLPRWMGGGLSYVSSHPSTAERITRLRKAAFAQ